MEALTYPRRICCTYYNNGSRLVSKTLPDVDSPLNRQTVELCWLCHKVMVMLTLAYLPSAISV